MAPSSPLRTSTDDSGVDSQLPQRVHPLMRNARKRTSTSPGHEHIEPAAGFSLLHTMQLSTPSEFMEVQSSTAAAMFAAHAPTPPPAATAQTIPQPRPQPGPQRQQPAQRQQQPRAPHVVQHCEGQLRRELGGITRRIFDIIGGRRRIDDLRNLDVAPIIHAAALTLSKQSEFKGIALQSFHASASADGDKVECLGSCRAGHRVRAFTGTFRRANGKTQSWTMTAFRVL